MIGRYKDSGTAKVTIGGNVLGKPVQQVVDLEFPLVDDDNPQIERMWAYSRVKQLMNEIRRSGETPKLKEEIIRLCEGYSIISEFASFIVLENDNEYKRWKIERRNATRLKRDRRAREKVRDELSEMRDRAMASLGPQPKDPNSRQTASNLPPRQTGSDLAPSDSRLSRSVEPTQPISTRNRDLEFSDSPNRSRRRGGGGAIDPITALIGAGLAGPAILRRRRTERKVEV